MAKITEGICGPISGKIGPIVGATWKGSSYIRLKAAKSDKPQTPQQRNNTSKFKFLNAFLKPFQPYITVGLKNKAKKMTSLNAAYSLNYKETISGTTPHFVIDYSKLIWSQGDLSPLRHLEVILEEKGTLKLIWEMSRGTKASPTDQVNLVVYCPELELVDGFTGGIRRDARQHIFFVNPIMLGKEIHVYTSLMSLNQEKMSDNQYLGVYTVR